ncbi:MAG: HAD family hydrolase [Microbacteriaceae bacterium]|nr:HAD family hydrolase [Microbacteriaceae bacterium]
MSAEFAPIAHETPAVEPVAAADRLLIALDIDGTVMHENGTITSAVIDAVQYARSRGHEVMLSTGRSMSMTLPVAARLGITPDYIVCSNGAITLKRDPDVEGGYSRHHIEQFDPTQVLTKIRAVLTDASYAVEDEEGFFHYTGSFPEVTLGSASARVSFEDLLGHRATRVVVISLEHELEEFLTIVERLGLHKVSYNVGWTAWLDIAPDGVNKATAMERVRAALKIDRSRVIAIGDGRNDIDMLTWAAAEGRGIAMGQAPSDVRAAANEGTESDLDDGVALILSAL